MALRIFELLGLSKRTMPSVNSFSTTVKNVLGLSHGLSECDIKKALVEFFVTRVFNEIYKLDKDASEEELYSKILEQVEIGDFYFPSQEFVENSKLALGLNSKTNDGVIYLVELKSMWIEDLNKMKGIDEIFEGKSKEFIFPKDTKTKDELYSYLKESVTIKLRNYYDTFSINAPQKTNEEFYEDSNLFFLRHVAGLLYRADNAFARGEITPIHKKKRWFSF